MKYSLALECIGDDRAAYVRFRNRSEMRMAPERELRYLYTDGIDWRQPWVAELSLARAGGLARRFLRGYRDVQRANSTGSRGVYLYFLLDDDRYYEVFARTSWKRSERYFLRVVGGRAERIDQEEVLRCLSINAASASTS